jgi:tetratricopeptide (TPR) repeat protein
MSTGDFRAAEKVLRECAAQANADAICQIGLAEVFSAQKQYDKAVELLSAELKRTPERREIRLAVANTNVMGEHYDVAVASFKEMIAKEPNSADLHLRLAETYRRMGDTPQAIETFRKVKQFAPNNPDAGLWLALLLHQTGREADAKVEYEQILRLQSDNAIALNNLAYVIAEQGGDMDMALTYAQRAKQKEPKNPEIADTLGWIYIRKGLHREALDIYRDLVGKAPENPIFRYHFAMALFQQGNKPQAKKELETALQNKPGKTEEGKIRELLQKVG